MQRTGGDLIIVCALIELIMLVLSLCRDSHSKLT